MLTANPITSFLMEDESLERFAGINAISGDLLRRLLDGSRSPGEFDLVGRAAMVSNPAALRWPGVMSASSSASTEQPISLETLDYQTSGLARWSNTLRGLQQEHFLEHLYSSQ